MCLKKVSGSPKCLYILYILLGYLPVFKPNKIWTLSIFIGYIFLLDIFIWELPNKSPFNLQNFNITQFNSDRFEYYPTELENYPLTLGHTCTQQN